MAHTIFLLHGMGEAKKDWATGVIGLVKDKYAEYDFAKEFPFDKSFEFSPLFYNDVFEKYLKAWDDNAKDLAKWGKLVAPLQNRFVNAMTKIAGDQAANNFAVRYIGDVLLYMLTDIREVVKGQVLTQFMEKLKPGAAGGWSMVSHSLGARVMTDVLQALFTDPTSDAYTNYGKAKVIMTVANVSLLLQEISKDVGIDRKGDVYHNSVFPSTTPGKGACGRFVNAAHDLDPFLFLFPFKAPDDFGNAPPFVRALYEDVRLRAGDLTGPNPHDLGHYLRHPDVHQALFQALVDPGGPPIVPEEERNKKEEQYRKEIEAAAQTAIAEKLKKLKVAGTDLGTLLDLLKRFGDLIDEEDDK